ncbi:MAG: copper amine oxidase N-terminal domain-containing protein [Candidatus Zipacnadales bacterium]
MHLRPNFTIAIVIIVSGLVIGSAVGAGETVLRGEGDIPLGLSGGERVSLPDRPLAVQGTLLVRPRTETPPGSWTTFIVDGQSKYSTNNPLAALELDTTTLPDGLHTIRIDRMDGSRRVATTGDITLEVANAAALSQISQAAPAQPTLLKLHHKKILREIVWFNGREGDLEKHATIRNGHVLITLTDLMRHLGGQVDWGPPDDLILATRGNTTVRVIPGSRTAYVNGVAHTMQTAAFRMGNRTYVPVRSMCRFFGVQVDWDIYTDRAYVTYQIPQ